MLRRDHWMDRSSDRCRDRLTKPPGPEFHAPPAPGSSCRWSQQSRRASAQTGRKRPSISPPRRGITGMSGCGMRIGQPPSLGEAARDHHHHAPLAKGHHELVQIRQRGQAVGGRGIRRPGGGRHVPRDGVPVQVAPCSSASAASRSPHSSSPPRSSWSSSSPACTGRSHGTRWPAAVSPVITWRPSPAFGTGVVKGGRGGPGQGRAGPFPRSPPKGWPRPPGRRIRRPNLRRGPPRQIAEPFTQHVAHIPGERAGHTPNLTAS